MEFSSTLIFAIVSMSIASGAEPVQLEGTTWRTSSGDSTIRIETCGAQTCGRILASSFKQGESNLDTLNPNPSKRSRAIVGLVILSGLVRQPDGSYKGGTIYNPEDGKTYRSELKLNHNGMLEVKGCIGPFCQTQVWIRSM